MSDGERLLSVGEAVAALRARDPERYGDLTAFGVRHMIRDGRLAATTGTRPGRKRQVYLIRESDLDRIEHRHLGPVPDARDERVYALWDTGRYRRFADLGRKLRLSGGEVRAAVERYRHRVQYRDGRRPAPPDHKAG